MKAMVWYRYPWDLDWTLEGMYCIDKFEFACTLAVLLNNPYGREFRVSYEWEWDI